MTIRRRRSETTTTGAGPGRAGGSTTPPAPSQGYPYASAGTPTPPAPSPAGYPHTPSAAPPHPHLCRGIPIHISGSPHPTRAFAGRIPAHSFGSPTPPAPAALLPRPLLGAGSVRGDIRGAAVPGSSPGSPHAVDRVDIATGGEADGEGELVPPPLSPTLQPSYFSPASPTPPAPLPAEALIRPSPASPPRPRLRRSSPAPPRAGSVPGRISGEQPYPGWSQWAAVFWVSPRSRRALDHGGYVRPPMGEAARREEVCPLPLSPTLPEPHPLSSGAGACVTIFNRRQCPVPPGFSPYSGPWWTPRVAGPHQALSGRTAFHHLHHDCAGGCPSGSEIAWRK